MKKVSVFVFVSCAVLFVSGRGFCDMKSDIDLVVKSATFEEAAKECKGCKYRHSLKILTAKNYSQYKVKYTTEFIDKKNKQGERTWKSIDTVLISDLDTESIPGPETGPGDLIIECRDDEECVSNQWIQKYNGAEGSDNTSRQMVRINLKNLKTYKTVADAWKSIIQKCRSGK